MADLSLAGVLPLKKEKEKTDSYELINFLFTSLIHFKAHVHFETFYIIVPDKCVDEVKKYVSGYSTHFTFKVLGEDALIGKMKPWVRGWRRQQLIKLAAGEFVNESHFMTFDADVICTRAFTKEEIFPNGKPLLQLMEKSDRPYWWVTSAELLGTEAFLDELGMGVTPAILNTNVVANLLQYLSSFGMTWVEYLLVSYKPFPINLFVKMKVWTEYSLYHLFLKKNNLVEKCHTVCDSSIRTRLISKKSAWYKEEFTKLDTNELFDENAPGIFCVIQSNMKLSVDEIRAKLEPILTTGSE